MNGARAIGDCQVFHCGFFAVTLAFGTFDGELLLLVVLHGDRTELLIDAEVHDEKEARRPDGELLQTDRLGVQRAFVVRNLAVLAGSCLKGGTFWLVF